MAHAFESRVRRSPVPSPQSAGSVGSQVEVIDCDTLSGGGSKRKRKRGVEIATKRKDSTDATFFGFFEYLQLRAREGDPVMWYILENVKTLSAANRKVIEDCLGSLGYHVLFLDLASADFLSPQERQRVYIVGWLQAWGPLGVPQGPYRVARRACPSAPTGGTQKPLRIICVTMILSVHCGFGSVARRCVGDVAIRYLQRHPSVRFPLSSK